MAVPRKRSQATLLSAGHPRQRDRDGFGEKEGLGGPRGWGAPCMCLVRERVRWGKDSVRGRLTKRTGLSEFLIASH